MSAKPSEPRKKNRSVDVGLLLLITGSISNIPLWIGVFTSTEARGPVGEWIRTALLPVVGGLSGLSMAITVGVGLVYVLGRLGKMQPTLERKVRGKDEYKSQPNVRFYVASGAIVTLFLISLAILSPYVYQVGSDAESLFKVLGNWAGLWSVGRVLAADLALAAVAAVHGAVALGSAEQTSKSLSEGEQPAQQTPAKGNVRLAKTSKPLSSIPCKYAALGCKHTEPTQGAINAHGGRCSFNPKNAKIAVEDWPTRDEK